jgi:hypothetical protein
MAEIRILRIWGKEGTFGVLYLYFPLSVIWVIKLKRMRLVEYEACPESKDTSCVG